MLGRLVSIKSLCTFPHIIYDIRNIVEIVMGVEVIISKIIKDSSYHAIEDMFPRYFIGDNHF
jgi:hypothetical protein